MVRLANGLGLLPATKSRNPLKSGLESYPLPDSRATKKQPCSMLSCCAPQVLDDGLHCEGAIVGRTHVQKIKSRSAI
jgi:hypothetical protein